MTIHWWFIMRITTNKCICIYVHLLYYKYRSFLHVAAACCDYLQADVLWGIYYIERQNNLIYKYKVLSIKQKLRCL
jgi:hypothetical protein